MRLDFGKKLFSYKTLYMLCFLAFSLIEFLKASQTGDVWYVAVNCTGLVMMVILYSAYPLGEFVTRVNVVYSLVCLGTMVGIYLHWRQNIGYYNLWQRETAVLNVWWIGILVKYLFQKIIVEKKMAFRPGRIGWLWIAMSVFMIASFSQRLWPLWYFFMFGAFYLTRFPETQKKALWDAMVDGIILGFFGIQIYAYGFRPYDQVRYVGAYQNTNAMALYYLIVYGMLLCKLHLLFARKEKWWKKLFFFIGAGGLLSFQIFTLCRTAWIVSGVITLLYAIYGMYRYRKMKTGKILLRGAALALAVLLTFLPVYETIRWLPTILHYRIWYEGEYSPDKVHSFDPADSEKYISLEEFLMEAGGRVVQSILRKEAVNPLFLRATIHYPERVELVDIPWVQDLSTKYRLTIYKAYLEDMTLFGNGPDKGYYYIGDSGYQSRHAQNLWIQMGYTYGIPVGILSIVLSFALLWRHGKGAWNARTMANAVGNPYAIIPILVCTIFLLFGLTEIVWNLGQLIMLLMFFVQHPQFYIKDEELEIQVLDD